MNNEQNIDDILKLLKESVSEDSAANKATITNTASKKKGAELSEDALKEQLKLQYAADGMADDSADKEELYSLDDTLLQEFSSNLEEEPAEETEELIAVDEEDTVKEPDESVAVDKDEYEDEEETVEELQAFAEVGQKEIVDDVDDMEELVTAEEEEPVENSETFDITESTEAFVEDNAEEYDPCVEFTESEEIIEDTEPETVMDYSAYPEIDQPALAELIRDNGDITASVIEDILADDDIGVELVTEDNGELADASARVNDSVYELLSQLGCEDELDYVDIDDISEEFSVGAECDAASSDGEYHCTDQKEEIRLDYSKRTLKQALRVGLMALATALSLLYDILPLFDFKISGIANPVKYPGGYILIGMQIMLLCAACTWRPLIRGLKKLVTFRADVYSMADLLLVSTIVYDLAMVVTSATMSAPQFHFLVSFILLGIEIGELAMLRREKGIFEIYSADHRKYSLYTDNGKHSSAEKMYAGGFDKEKGIHTPLEVNIPNGFFRSVRAEDNNRLLSVMVVPIFLFAIIFAVCSMMLEESISSAFVAAMTVLFAALPTVAILAHYAPWCISAFLLKRRGIAISGPQATDKYTNSGALVFSDMHLFRNCKTQDTGMVFYEKSQTADIFGCMQLLYSHIGGPMGAVFDGVPEDLRAKELRVRRIARGGIEALIDRKHVLLVGDIDFMKRYGFNFPTDNTVSDRVSLCISLDGKMSAKMSVRYSVEPIFEMLIERLAKEKIQCAVETFDPMINASVVAVSRRMGATPISVIHKNISDLKYENTHSRRNREDTDVVVISSRLKLAEAVVWCKRIFAVKRISNMLACTFSVLGTVLAALMLIGGAISAVNQYWMLLWVMLGCTAMLGAMLFMFPSKNYFTVDEFKRELALDAQKKAAKVQKGQNKKSKKVKDNE